MKTASVLILIALLFTAHIATAQARYVTFTDSEGRRQRHELAADSVIVTRRPDDTAEITIGYANGALSTVFTQRPDRTAEVQIDYENGALRIVGTRRPDGSTKAAIVNGVCTQ